MSGLMEVEKSFDIFTYSFASLSDTESKLKMIVWTQIGELEIKLSPALRT